MVQVAERIPDARSDRRVTASMVLIGIGALLVTIGPFQTWLRLTNKFETAPGARTLFTGLHLVGGMGYVLAESAIVALLSLLVPVAKVRVVFALLCAGYAGTVAYTGLASMAEANHISLGVGWWLVTIGAVTVLIGGIVGQFRDV